MFPGSWIKIKMAQAGRNISYILRNPQNHCLEMKCFAPNLWELDSYVTQSSGDKKLGRGNKATLKRNIHL